jgi:hypothetical protein
MRCPFWVNRFKYVLVDVEMSEFLERCKLCEYMARDKDVKDMLCIIDGKTCQAVEIELQLEEINGCDCFKQSYEFEDLRSKE